MVSTERVYSCNICKDDGYTRHFDDNGYEFVRTCECERVKQSMRIIKASGLSDVVDTLTFDKFETTEPWQEIAKRQAVEYSDNPNGRWFFVGGQVGSGKTHLCTAITIKLLKQGKRARYMLWRDEVVRLKAVINEDEYYEKIRQLKTTEVLYIDDFFKTERGKPPTSADINIAFELINYRYINRNLITIISCEQTIEDLIDIDEAVGSRIYERTKGNGGYLVIGNDRNKNYRLRR